jgi:hypothetical protein
MESRPVKGYKSYKCLDFLDKEKIKYTYTPFDHGALVEILDPKWTGACMVLANEWMISKISAEDINVPIFRQITNSSLPHFVNVIDEKTAREIETHLENYYNTSHKDQWKIEKKYKTTQTYAIGKQGYNLDKSIDSLLDYISSKKFHYGYIDVNLLILDENAKDLPRQIGHRISFVKRDDEISFFDPNYGEITFSKCSDFKKWFKEEVKNGVLNFFITTDSSERKYTKLSDVFPQPSFTEQQQENENPFSKQIIKRRTEIEKRRSSIEKFMVANYQIHSFYGERYIKPENWKQETIAQEEKAKLIINQIKNSLFKKSIFGSSSTMSDTRNRLLWDLIRSAENGEIKYADALIKINKMHKFKIETPTDEVSNKVTNKVSK